MSLTYLPQPKLEPTMNRVKENKKEDEVWKVLTTYLPPAHNPSHHAWWTSMAPILGRSLALTGHPAASQYENLLLIQSTLIPFLGPSPDKYESSTRWKSCIEGGKGPLDISINYQRSKATFRITIEPIGEDAGTDVDPLNEVAPRQLLQRLQMIQEIYGSASSSGSGIDLTWYNQLEHDLVLSNHEARDDTHKDLISQYAIKTQRLIGLDLHGSSAPTVKAYFFPHIRATAMCEDWAVLLFSSVRKLCTLEAFQRGVSMIETYVLSIRDRLIPEKPNVAIDCLSPERSRAKIYVAVNVDRIEEVHDLWTLGGAVDSTPELESGFEIIRQVWEFIYPRSLPGEEKRKAMTVHCNWELYASSSSVNSTPVPKIYFLLADDYDRTISEAVVDLFGKLGWDQHVVTHRAAEEEAYYMCDMVTSTGVYTWLSFAYSKTSGPYITVYSKPVVG